MQRKNVATRLIRFIDEKGMIRHGQMVGNDFNQSDLIENDDIFGSRVLTGERIGIKKLLAPLQPTQIIGIGLNYRKHAEETNMPLPEHPVVFFKNNHSIQHPNDPIIIPSIALSPPEVDYEVELAVVIAKTCKNVSEASALQYVLGYTVANDVSARRWQGKRSGNQWCRAKSFDTFCPLGPSIVTDIRDPQNLSLSTVLNGKTMQSSNTKDMIFSVSKLISRLSDAMTLAQGTVILTGTPEGVGFTQSPAVYLHPGDTVVTQIEGIGALENNVVAERKSAL